VQLFDFKITDGSILFIKISESKNRWFRSFEKKKKKIRIRELMGFSYFRNIKELAVFMKEWGKEPAGRKGSIF